MEADHGALEKRSAHDRDVVLGIEEIADGLHLVEVYFVR
jgi:hypothetical protein